MSTAAAGRASHDAVIPRDVIIALMKAADGTRRAMTRVLQEFDLTLSQFNVLIILLREQELPTLEVAARLVEDTPGITRLMNALVGKRYIRRRQSKEDRRQQLCSLTHSGRRVINAVIPGVRAAQERVIGGLNHDEMLQLIGLLRRLRGPHE
jgi:DNA-binding MarR family transcriptional regulator